MALREWTEPRGWMVKPTPQTEWIERRGLLIWIAEVFTSIGTGLYLVSLFYNSPPGMLAGWLVIVLLKMFPHLFYLGKPLRFWRMIPPFTKAWKTSWIARGLFFTLLFSALAPAQLFISRLLPGTGLEITLKIFTGTAALLAGIYSGFALSYCKSVPFWNSALLPIVFLFTGIADGLALIMVVSLADASVDTIAIESLIRWVLILNALILTTYLWHATNASKTAKYSAMLLLKGRLAFPFWSGVVTCGVLIPMTISFSSLFAGESTVRLLFTAASSHTIGAFAFKYCLLKAGIHNPVLPITSAFN